MIYVYGTKSSFLNYFLHILQKKYFLFAFSACTLYIYFCSYLLIMEMCTNLVPERDEEEDRELGDLLQCLEESPFEREPE